MIRAHYGGQLGSETLFNPDLTMKSVLTLEHFVLSHPMLTRDHWVILTLLELQFINRGRTEISSNYQMCSCINFWDLMILIGYTLMHRLSL